MAYMACSTLDKENTSSLHRDVQSLQQRERDLQRRNNELQHMLLDVQTKLEVMRENAKSSNHVCINYVLYDFVGNDRFSDLTFAFIMSEY